MLKLNYIFAALSIYSLSNAMQMPRITDERQMHLQERLNDDIMNSFVPFPNYSYFALPLNIDPQALSKIAETNNKKSEAITYSSQIVKGAIINDELKAQANNPAQFVAPFGAADSIAVITVCTYGISQHKILMPLTDRVLLTKKAIETQLARRFSYIDYKSRKVKDDLLAQHDEQIRKNLATFKAILCLKVFPSVAYCVAEHISKDIVSAAAEYLSYPKIPMEHPVSAQEQDKETASIRAMKDLAIATSYLKKLKALKKNHEPHIKFFEKKFETDFCKSFENYIHTQYTSRNV